MPIKTIKDVSWKAMTAARKAARIPKEAWRDFEEKYFKMHPPQFEENPRVRRREVKSELESTEWDSQKGRDVPTFSSTKMRSDLKDLSMMVGAANRVAKMVDTLSYIKWSPSDYKKFQDIKKMLWKAQTALIKAWERYDAEAAREYRKTMGKRKER